VCWEADASIRKKRGVNMRYLSKLILLVLVISIAAASVSAVINVTSVKEYTEFGQPITRSYLIDGDYIIFNVVADRLYSSMYVIMDPADGSTAACQNLGNLHYRCKNYIWVGPTGLHSFSIEAKEYDSCDTYRTDSLLTAYLNPRFNLSESGVFVFGDLVPGATVNSSIFGVFTTPPGDLNGSLKVRLYVRGKNTYSLIGPARCPTTNIFPLNRLQYRVNNGSWKNLPSFLTPIGYNNVTIQFRAKVPAYCTGDYPLVSSITFAARIEP
jgi:hypothetical protein